MEPEPSKRTSFEHKRKPRESFTDTPYDDNGAPHEDDGCMTKFFKCVFQWCTRSEHHSRRHNQLSETKPNISNKTPNDAPPPAAKNDMDEFAVVVEDESPKNAAVVVFQDDSDDENTNDLGLGSSSGVTTPAASEDLARESSDSFPVILESPAAKTPPQQPDSQEDRPNGDAGIVLESVPNDKKTV